MFAVKIDLKEKDIASECCSFILRLGHGQPLVRFDSPGLLLCCCCLAAKKDLGEDMSATVLRLPEPFCTTASGMNEQSQTPCEV